MVVAVWGSCVFRNYSIVLMDIIIMDNKTGTKKVRMEKELETISDWERNMERERKIKQERQIEQELKMNRERKENGN